MNDNEWAMTYIEGQNTDAMWTTSNTTMPVTPNAGSVTITGPDGSTVKASDISFSWDTSGALVVVDCLVCGEAQEHQVCEVCAVAVKEYRNELYLKQIKDLL